jgi:hypothetical protein
MKIELKKFQFFERMSEETNAFASDIHVEGKKVGYAKNDGHGGETYYHFYEGGRDLMNKAEKFCKSLPPIVLDGLSGKPFEIKMDLTHFIDDLVEALLKEKEDKKINKLKETCLIIGHVLKKGSYSYINFKQPLSQVPLAELQKYVNKYKLEMKKTQCFWNTNLEELGIKL